MTKTGVTQWRVAIQRASSWFGLADSPANTSGQARLAAALIVVGAALMASHGGSVIDDLGGMAWIVGAVLAAHSWLELARTGPSR